MALKEFTLLTEETNLTQYSVELLTTEGNNYVYYVFSPPMSSADAQQAATDMCNQDFVDDENPERVASVVAFEQFDVRDNPELDNEEEINYFLRMRYGEGVEIYMESINFDSWDYDFLDDYTGPREQR